MVLTGSCPCLWPWLQAYGAHLRLQAREVHSLRRRLRSRPLIPYFSMGWILILFLYVNQRKVSPASGSGCGILGEGSGVICPGHNWISMPPADLKASSFSPLPPAQEIDKASVRRDMMRRAQSAAAAYGEDAARHVADILIPALSLPAGATVAGYAPLKSEIDPTPILDALFRAGHRVALPVIEGDDVPLTFRSWRPGDKLIAGPFGTRTSEAGELIEPVLVLVPLVSFDDQGHRLGRGGGYYDRTLNELRARGPVLAIGLAFDCQRHAGLPIDAHDEALEAVVTERGLHRFAPSPLLDGRSPSQSPNASGQTSRRRGGASR